MEHPSRRSKSLALGILTILGVLLPIVPVGGARNELSPSPQASGELRVRVKQSPQILYVGSWTGARQIYSVDPSSEGAPAQLTFATAPSCGQATCNFTTPVPSPDGRKVLFFAGEPARCALFVARANGTQSRRLATGRNSCYSGEAAWAGSSQQIAYDVGGDVHIARADGSRNRSVGSGSRPAWSRDGRSLAFLDDRGIEVVQKGRLRHLPAANAFAWSPNGKWIAYLGPARASSPRGPSRLGLVRPDGTGRRILATADDPRSELAWSADGRFLAFDDKGVRIVDTATGTLRVVNTEDGYGLAWSPRGRLLAYGSGARIRVAEATGTDRVLTAEAGEFAWSPDADSLAYIVSTSDFNYQTGDLKLVDLSGHVRTLVAAAGDYGGWMDQLVWTRPPADMSYRPAAARTIATVSANQLLAPWPITRLAADGGRVAYVSCGRVFAWLPATGAVVQTEPQASLSPRCTIGDNYNPFEIYTLALAGDRIAFGAREGNTGQGWWLYEGELGPPQRFVTLDWRGGASGCPVVKGGLGDLAGSERLLVFSTWRDDQHCPAVTTEQQIERVESAGCPCPVIAASQGPLVPFDVDGGRVAAGGDNATVLLDSAGTQLLSVAVSPLAVQLAGSELVVLVQGELRDYDASTGALRHAWPLANVPSSGECASPHRGSWGCGWQCSDSVCSPPRLLLEDAARGLVTYVLDGHVHLLRLSDGADATVADGTLARFMDAGLAYVDGARIHLVPFGSLPLGSRSSTSNRVRSAFGQLDAFVTRSSYARGSEVMRVGVGR